MKLNNCYFSPFSEEEIEEIRLVADKVEITDMTVIRSRICGKLTAIFFGDSGAKTDCIVNVRYDRNCYETTPLRADHSWRLEVIEYSDKYVKSTHSTNHSTKPTTMSYPPTKINPLIETFVSEEAQNMIKAGIMNRDLTLTSGGVRIVAELMAAKHTKELAAMAERILASKPNGATEESES